MRRILALIIIVAMTLSFVACGDGDKSAGTSGATEGTTKGTSEAVNTTAAITTDAELPPFDEILVVDNDECLINITSINPKGTWGYTIKVYMENKSDDKTYWYRVDSIFINGVQASTIFSENILPGKKSNGEIVINADLDGVIDRSEYSDIELVFIVTDDNDWSADPVAHERVRIYPFGEERAVKYVREPQDTDTVIVDTDDVQVIVTGYDPEYYWGYLVNLYIVNKSDRPLNFSISDASVNGYMMTPFWGELIDPGKVCFSSLCFSKEQLEENKITAVEEIEMTFKCYQAVDWSFDYVVDEIIKLNP